MRSKYGNYFWYWANKAYDDNYKINNIEPISFGKIKLGRHRIHSQSNFNNKKCGNYEIGNTNRLVLNVGYMKAKIVECYIILSIYIFKYSRIYALFPVDMFYYHVLFSGRSPSGQSNAQAVITNMTSIITSNTVITLKLRYFYTYFDRTSYRYFKINFMSFNHLM